MDILNILDEDLVFLTKEELNIIKEEIISITRMDNRVELVWKGENSGGDVNVLPNTIILRRGNKDFYLRQPSIDYLVRKGYDIPDYFFYDYRDRY